MMRMTCRDVEAQLAPFVDGEIGEAEARPIAAHLEACPPCQRMAQLEQMGRRALRDCAPRLMASVQAPAALRASVRRAIPAPRHAFRLRWLAASAAATVIAAVGLVAVAGVIRPIPVFAAQATLDHLKCVRLGPSASSSDAKALEAAWRNWQGWDLHVPTGQPATGFRLLGYRRCVITEGRMAHLLYERKGEIVSLFVVPDGPKVEHAELEMFGQDAVLWTSHGLTYALVGRGSRADMAVLASSLKDELEHELAAGAAPAGSGL